MNIAPGIGLNNIRFGITEANVIALLGEPNKAQNDPGTERRQLQYNSLRSTFCFDDTNLHWIHCSHPELKVNGQRLYGIPTENAVPLLEAELGESPKREEYYGFECYSFEANCLTMHVEYGLVNEIQFGYLFDDNDEPILPT